MERRCAVHGCPNNAFITHECEEHEHREWELDPFTGKRESQTVDIDDTVSHCVSCGTLTGNQHGLCNMCLWADDPKNYDWPGVPFR